MLADQGVSSHDQDASLHEAPPSRRIVGSAGPVHGQGPFSSASFYQQISADIRRAYRNTTGRRCRLQRWFQVLGIPWLGFQGLG